MLHNFIKGNFTPPNCVSDCITTSKPRIEFVDLAKGVCILLVVFVHSRILVDPVPALEALRMPLYFILSGLFFKDYGSLYNFIEKKVNKILIPFLFFYFFSLAILFLLDGKWGIYEIVRPIFDPNIHNGPLWFLSCLFIVNVMYCTISISVKGMIIKTLIVLICGVVGYILSVNDIYLPMYVNVAFTALPFFYIGFILRKLPILYRNKFDRYNLFFSIVLILPIVVYCIYNGTTPHVDFFANKYYGNPFVIYVVSISLVVGLLLLCKAIKWIPIVAYFGRYSIIVLGFHYLFLLYGNIPVYVLTGHVMDSMEVFLFTLLLCWVSIPLCIKIVPGFTAQKDIFKWPKRLSPKIVKS